MRLYETKSPFGCLLVGMQTNDKARLCKLEEGQLWKVEHGYVYIEELGERLIRYKMLRQPNVKAAITQMIRLEALLNFLRQAEAELVCSDDAALERPRARQLSVAC